MRYGFVLLSVIVAWIVGIIISYLNLTTEDRLYIYFAMVILTTGMFLIGFTARKL